MNNEGLSESRRGRVNRLKRLIVVTIGVTILIPWILCVILGVRLHQANERLAEEMEKTANLQNQIDELQKQVNDLYEIYGNAQVEDEASIQERENTGSEKDAQSIDGKKRVYLTFDDGPSSNTTKILDKLKEYDVKATFFVTGANGKALKALYGRIVDEGHGIGVHSYSHKYDEIYASIDDYFEDFYMMSDTIYDATGVRSTICRLPGGSSNTVSKIDMRDVVTELNKQGIACYDWNVSGEDAKSGHRSAEQIAENVLSGIEQYDTAIVLLHDGADKDETVKALDLILKELTQNDKIVMEPITKDTPTLLHILVDN